MTQPAEYSFINPDHARSDQAADATRAANHALRLTAELPAIVGIAVSGKRRAFSHGRTRAQIERIKCALDVALANVEAIENG